VAGSHGRPWPDCAALHAERRKPGVTLELLHLEYLEQHPDGYRYTQFCEIYRRWLGRRGLTMRQVHHAGEKEAVALTAVVHFLNGLFKVGLVARYADVGIVLRFGVFAILASFVGALLLLWLSGVEPLLTYHVWDARHTSRPSSCWSEGCS
jgi:hypothetical protein